MNTRRCEICLTRLEHMDAPLNEKYLRMMSAERTARLYAYRQHHDRVRCLTAWLLARYTAGKWFGTDDREIQIFMSQGMPPYALCQGEKCFLSISHAQNYVMCMAGSVRCGADIESVRHGRDMMPIAKDFFCPEETDWVRSADTPEEQQKRLIRIWTLKEAYLKLCGTGLRRELNSFRITAEAETFRIEDDASGGQIRILTGEAEDLLYSAVAEGEIGKVHQVEERAVMQ